MDEVERYINDCIELDKFCRGKSIIIYDELKERLRISCKLSNKKRDIIEHLIYFNKIYSTGAVLERLEISI